MTVAMSRSLPLDALRGLAIVLMVFSGLIPFKTLPDWMYHAQVPPPAHVFNPAIPGITWVDLVFPFFLFAMGAAIPLALHARLRQGDGLGKISLGILQRGALLVFFAIYVKHIQPSVMAENPGAWEWALSLTGFLLLFPMLARLPSDWPATKKILIRTIGWIGAAILLFLFAAKDGSAFGGAFNVKRSDIIILVLANVAVSGSFIWLATRTRLDLRLGILAFLFALRLTQSLPGWGQWLWNLSPVPWLGTVYFQQYLFIIIPGTIAGDLLLKSGSPSRIWPDAKIWIVCALGPVLVLVLLIGMKGRWVVETTIASIAICALAWSILRRAESDANKLLRALAGWGIFWLLLGLAFEPFEGGIKKDRATMSYYFVTSGLAFFLLASLIVAIDLCGIRLGFKTLIATGQNPMVAYAGAQSLLQPILGLTGLGTIIGKLTASSWPGALRAGAYTGAVAWVGAWCAKRGVVLRT
jgi:predicted acyltransferase